MPNGSLCLSPLCHPALMLFEIYKSNPPLCSIVLLYNRRYIVATPSYLISTTSLQTTYTNEISGMQIAIPEIIFSLQFP